MGDGTTLVGAMILSGDGFDSFLDEKFGRGETEGGAIGPGEVRNWLL